MKASVHFLNVGWGDAHFIRLPSGALTLIDGGEEDLPESCVPPEAWMERQGATELAWMLLTHLHGDHVNGLLEVARRFKVRRAVLPYEPFVLPIVSAQRLENDRKLAIVFKLLNRYLELVQLLEQAGTIITWRHQLGSEGHDCVWSEEGFTLKHLYPWHDDPLPAHVELGKALEALTLSEEEGCVRLKEFYELSNHDSSVYRLTADKQQGQTEGLGSVLFGADQLEPGWRTLAARQDIRSHVWKASHHGMTDGVNPQLLQLIQPQHTVIPISLERAESESLYPHWERLKEQGVLPSYFLTGAIKPGEALEIPDQQGIEVWVEGRLTT
ncbi:ComEC/Rec2 family competence protein [Paenibacillus sp. N3.4]|uniref:ComEC/Rec2 family competence protein n=1 Tax=Paenibacillus sp. N3.4 TaxID=2603222 RepID=UPI0011C71DEA|nr:MBL fold metallo-hydrolase [Paenibacillus sp. N3.4]TXK76789.1 MBL fold metallo-hydrolase [Paenibacillus sp. N3.4]